MANGSAVAGFAMSRAGKVLLLIAVGLVFTVVMVVVIYHFSVKAIYDVTETAKRQMEQSRTKKE